MSSWRHVKVFSREPPKNTERMGLKLDNLPFKFDLNMCECLSACALTKAQTHTTLQLYIKLLRFLSRFDLLFLSNNFFFVIGFISNNFFPYSQTLSPLLKLLPKGSTPIS